MASTSSRSTIRTLDQRLQAAAIAPDADPVEAWRQLRKLEVSVATIVDLYELAARRRGVRADDLPAAERHALARSVMPDIWPDWAVAPGSERNDVITIVDYDPAWPDRFVVWKRALHAGLGTTAVHIEHIGSTSVPGLAAKPIIDVQVSVADLAAEPAYVPQLEAIGLQLRSRDVFHCYFRPFAGRPRDVHVHVCPVGSAWETEHLRFRDYLRTHPAACEKYARAKRAAVARWADDGMAYTDAKSEVILDISEQSGPIGSDVRSSSFGRGVRIVDPD